MSGTGIVLKWTASPSEDVLRYHVYRDGRLVEDNVRTATYTDPYVLHDKEYDYTVTAVDKQANESAKSVKVSVVAPREGLAPAPVTGVSATPRKDGVAVKWQPGTSEDISQYQVYKGEYAAGTWTYHLLWETWYSIGDDSFYFDETPADGETVRYAVVAVDESGNTVDTGETFSFVTVTNSTWPPPRIPTPPGAPLQLTARSISEAVGELPGAVTPRTAPGATASPCVYRWDGQTSSYVRLTNTPLSVGPALLGHEPPGGSPITTGSPRSCRTHKSAPAAATDRTGDS